MEEETWFVQLAGGGVRMMDVEQLDAAFQSGTIDEDTLVRRDGTSQWVKLSEELAMSSPPPPPTESGTGTATATVTATATESVSTHPVVSDVMPSTDDIDHDDLEAALNASRRRRRVAFGVLAAGVVAGFATITAINVVRLQKHAALAAELATVRVSAPSDPEPEATTKTTTSQNQPRPRKSRNTAQGASSATPDDKPASTVFQNGGDQYDPLNGKL